MTTPTNLDKRNKTLEADLAEQLAAGSQMHLATMSQILVAGGALTPAQAEAKLAAIATLRSAVSASRIALQANLAAEAAQLPALRTFLLAFVAFVRGTFGNSPDVLADFGLLPRRAMTVPTAEQKMAAAAKRMSTREARGTKGKKARLAVKGAVTGVVVTPVTSGPATKS